ncbi:type I DNA topoisomerase [Hahella ganghwensis]|uniref:type I DNA topoisomerase n=1 Tax=Hahella ganghwensis TaxID=286420 RepID=UPI00036B5037|nr:type I DNA topoisomerase [Hahella ganghwensis]
MKLMIVESPAKGKQIRKYLGEGWQVAASVGHIRDLPDDEMGVEPPSFKPKYVIYKNKQKVVSNLRSLVAKASEVYLATDRDREGEAIAFHLKSCLNLHDPIRLTFDEVTKAGLQKSLQNPRKIDYRLVGAQETRRVLDRIVGYYISPIISEQSGLKLSAGRVQSPAVLLAVLREQEIRSFTKQNFYLVAVTCPNGLTAFLDPKGWCKDGKHIFDKQVADAIAREVNQVSVTSVSIDDKRSNPRPPFTTSTMQQAASSAIKLSPRKTMQAAQSLFEQGVITYHRTDKPNLSNEGFRLATKQLTEMGFDYQEQQIIRESKAGAQEAHEAIRPTDFTLEEAGEDSDQQKLYALIRERSLSSAMRPAIDSVTTIVMTAHEQVNVVEYSGYPVFTVSGKVEKYKGWRAICSIEKPSKKATDKELPALVNEGESLAVSTELVTKTTEPPPRYTEASLVAALEKQGIGRPSTYDQIIETIVKRAYIKIEKGRIYSEELAERLVEGLRAMSFLKLDYTKQVEDRLDDIAQGTAKYLQVVTDVYETIVAESSHISMSKLVTTAPCPLCQKDLKQLPSKKRGGSPFWVHLEDSDCERYLSDQDGVPVYREKQEYETAACPGCQKEIKRIVKGEKIFWAHSQEKDAKGCVKFLNDNEGTPVIQGGQTSDCPACSKKIIRKYSKNKDSYFWMHKADSHAKKCRKFIRDQDGIPTV